MKNKLIFLIVVLVLLFGMLFIIGKNRSAREIVRIKEKNRIEREQIVKDSLRKREQIVQDSLQNIRLNIVLQDKKESNRSYGSEKTNLEKEDFSSYINSSITNSSSNTSVAVTVVEENGNVSSTISSSIANVYTQTGNMGNTGLIRSSFLHKPGFQELFEGNSEIIDKLQLNKHTDYVAIGKISYSTRKGTLVDATYVCTVSLTMNIISAHQMSLAKSFTCSASGNGATEDQAKEYAIEKLINKYISDYSSI